ncbi:MAG: lipid-A-disaccharide synthase [Bacteroidota bacterium]|nr:lipid-A-disaccharide synthase [Bacteroidota bacterium]
MRYYIISGEASGDLHGSKLIREIKKKDKDSEFRCWGGDLMQKEGGLIVKHYRDLAFMGFLEVVMNLDKILKNISFCKKDIIEFRPDILILIDYPGFNLRIAKFAKEYGFKVCYYITPQIWAWKSSRVKIIKKYIDKILVILPFEKEFFRKFNCEVDFVGHPLLDSINEIENDSISEDNLKSLNPDSKPIIALLPGSRKQEINKMLPLMINTAFKFPDYKFIIAGVKTIPQEFYQKLIKNSGIEIYYDKTYFLLKNSKAALVTSGTATLETALINIPEIVCYKANPLSVTIARLLIKVRYISLVNLIMDKRVVVELIQNDYNITNIENELNKILSDKIYNNNILKDYKTLREKLGGIGASSRAADIICSYLST